MSSPPTMQRHAPLEEAPMRQPPLPSLLAGIAIAALLGCPPAKKPQPQPDAAGDADAGPSRSYLLGGRAEAYAIAHQQRVVATRPLGDVCVPVQGDAGAAGDGEVGPDGADAVAQVCGPAVEAVVVPADLLGIPWGSFTGPDNLPAELPAPWFSAVQAARAEVEALGLPIVLALSPLSEEQDALALEATDQGGTLGLKPFKVHCYDPTKEARRNLYEYPDAYAGYVRWMVGQFDPRWVVLAQRVNRYYDACGANDAAYAGILGFAAKAHARLQDLDEPPVTVVSVDVEDLYGYPPKAGRCVGLGSAACLDQRKKLLAGIEADRLGLESHPASALAELGALPSDWLSRVAAARPELPPVVSGTGLPAVSLSSPGGMICAPLLESSEAVQLEWLDQVVATATNLDMDLVVWSSPEDLLDAVVVASCPCHGDQALCQHLDQLGAKTDEVRLRTVEGLWSTDGAPRAAAAIWEQLRLGQ